MLRTKGSDPIVTAVGETGTALGWRASAGESPDQL